MAIEVSASMRGGGAWTRDLGWRSCQDGPPHPVVSDSSAKIRILQLKSRQIDHRLGQGATKAMVSGCLMGVYLTGVHLMGVHLMVVYLICVHLMNVHLMRIYFIRRMGVSLRRRGETPAQK